MIDLPAVLVLSLFRPLALPVSALSSLHRLESIRRLAHEFLTPFPSPIRFATTTCLTLALLGITAPILAFNKPAAVTATYEVLEPETWVGKELPILEQIDIAEALKRGAWLLLFYHHDCPDCRQAIPQYGQMARDLAGNEDFLRIALIEVPPYGPRSLHVSTACVSGRLAATKEWFITTPAVVLLTNTRVKAAWEETAPDFQAIMWQIAESERRAARSPSGASVSPSSQTLYHERR
jgi:thiol-disulfide isomerase/thioredoxin